MVATGISRTDSGARQWKVTASGTNALANATVGANVLGTFFTVSAGAWEFAKAATLNPAYASSDPANPITGYQLDFTLAQNNGCIVTTKDGKQYAANMTAGAVETPQLIGAGASMGFGLQTDRPFSVNGIVWNAGLAPMPAIDNDVITSVSIPFCITYLVWLSGVAVADVNVGTNACAVATPCCYSMVYHFNYPGAAGAPTDSYTVSSIDLVVQQTPATAKVMSVCASPDICTQA